MLKESLFYIYSKIQREQHYKLTLLLDYQIVKLFLLLFKLLNVYAEIIHKITKLHCIAIIFGIKTLELITEKFSPKCCINFTKDFNYIVKKKKCCMKLLFKLKCAILYLINSLSTSITMKKHLLDFVKNISAKLRYFVKLIWSNKLYTRKLLCFSLQKPISRCFKYVILKLQPISQNI